MKHKVRSQTRFREPGRVPPSVRSHNFWRRIRSQGPSGSDWGRILAPQGAPEMVKIHQKSQKRGFEHRVDFRTSFCEAPGWICHGFWSPKHRFWRFFFKVILAQISNGKNISFLFFSQPARKHVALKKQCGSTESVIGVRQN